MTVSELEQDLYTWNLWDWNKIATLFELNSNILCENLWLRVITKMTLRVEETIVIYGLWFRSHQEHLPPPQKKTNLTSLPHLGNNAWSCHQLHYSLAYGPVKNSTKSERADNLGLLNYLHLSMNEFFRLNSIAFYWNLYRQNHMTFGIRFKVIQEVKNRSGVDAKKSVMNLIIIEVESRWSYGFFVYF